MKKLQVNPLFFVVLAIVYMTDNLYFFLLTYLSLCLHELVHLLFICKNNLIIEKIKIEPFGIAIYADYPKNVSPFVFLSAPLFNLLIAVLIFKIEALKSQKILFMIMSSNLFLGLFNLLPVLPFDGGRALEAYLYSKKRNSEKTLKILSIITGIILTVAGILFLKITQYNFSICTIGLFIIYNAFNEGDTYKLKKGRTIISKAYSPMHSLNAKTICVPYDYPAHKVLREFKDKSYYIVNVIKNGIITKTLTEAQIIEKVTNSKKNLIMYEI